MGNLAEGYGTGKDAAKAISKGIEEGDLAHGASSVIKAGAILKEAGVAPNLQPGSALGNATPKATVNLKIDGLDGRQQFSGRG